MRSREDIARQLCADGMIMGFSSEEGFVEGLEQRAQKQGIVLGELLKDPKTREIIRNGLFSEKLYCIAIARYLLAKSENYWQAASGNEESYYRYLQASALNKGSSIDTLLREAEDVLSRDGKIQSAIQGYFKSSFNKPPSPQPAPQQFFKPEARTKTPKEIAQFLHNNRHTFSNGGNFKEKIFSATKEYSNEKYTFIDLLRNKEARTIILSGRIQCIVPLAVAEYISSQAPRYLDEAFKLVKEKMPGLSPAEIQKHAMAVFIKMLGSSVEDKGVTLNDLLNNEEARAILLSNDYTKAAIIYLENSQGKKAPPPRFSQAEAGLLTIAGIPQEARDTPEHVVQAARQLAKIHHPDKNNDNADPEALKAILEILRLNKEHRLEEHLHQRYPGQPGPA